MVCRGGNGRATGTQQFTAAFDTVFTAAGIEVIRTPAQALTFLALQVGRTGAAATPVTALWLATEDVDRDGVTSR